MNIVFLSHTYIGSPYVVGSHHLARELSKAGHNILHISHPKSLFHFLLRKKRPGELRGLVSNKLWQYAPFVFLPLKFSTRLASFKFYHFLMYKQIKLYECLAGMNEVDYYIIDDPSFYVLIPFLGENKVVYRPTDIYSEMQSSGYLKKHEELLVKSSIALISTNKNILDYLPNHEKSYVIPNGFDYSHFNMSVEKKIKKTKDTGDLCKPVKVCYVGSLDKRFDFGLLESIASENIIFEIYSPDVYRFNNKYIYHRGVADYNILPDILINSDILCMPFVHQLANEGRSPMKLFEYASTGLPLLVPAFINDYGFPGIFKYSSDEEFYLAIMNIIDNKKRVYIRNSERLRENSWANKSMKFLDILRELE